MNKIDIVIVNWNSGIFLKKCVCSINNLENHNFVNNIIIVDNNSYDNSAQLVKNKKKVKLIFEKKNYGFAKGCNIGASYSKEKYILFLNPDCELFDDTLEKVNEFMEKKTNDYIGVCGVKMVDKDDKIVLSTSRFPSIFNIFLKSFGLDRIFKSYSMLMRDFDHESSRFVDQIIGAFFFVRKDVFDDLSGFDEDFFLYMDEVDFSLRLRKIGFQSYYLSTAKCYHEGGVSSDKNLLLRNLNFQKSRLIYGFKHFNSYEKVLLVIITFIIEPITRFIFYFCKFSFKDIKLLLITQFLLLKTFLLKK